MVSESFCATSFGGSLYVVFATLPLFFDFEEPDLLERLLFDLLPDLEDEFLFFELFLDDFEDCVVFDFLDDVVACASNAPMPTIAAISRYIIFRNFIQINYVTVRCL
jgi:hypothetical protein